MGTRHMIAVILGGEPRIAQYGQWDGYPDGQGVDVLAFAQGLSGGTIPGVLDKFKAQVAKCRFLPEDEANAIFQESPWMSRDTGSDILDLVMKAPDGLPLFSSYKFARNGLMCEWAYVLDLDQEQLEVYRGFGKGDAPEGERFGGPGLDNSSGYGPVRLAKVYKFADLPSRGQFLADLQGEKDEDEAA